MFVKPFYSFLIVILFLACQPNNKKPTNKSEETKLLNQIELSNFQSILDSNNVRGAILFYDLEKDSYYSNDFVWANKGHLPASTFKIINTIIGLESGILENENHVFQWEGNDRYLKSWEQDLFLKEAFQYSCVPCYQELAREIGPQKMNQYLNILNYGNMDVDSNNIDNFWLTGKSKINQFQQIDFLKRLYKSKLPITKKTDSIIKEVMLDETQTDFKLSAKTGLSIAEDYQNGWYVGYIEDASNTYFFATNISPKGNYDQESFIPLRKIISFQAFKELKLIE